MHWEAADRALNPAVFTIVGVGDTAIVASAMLRLSAKFARLSPTNKVARDRRPTRGANAGGERDTSITVRAKGG